MFNEETKIQVEARRKMNKCCKNGHLRTKDNTYLRKDGNGVMCEQCNKERLAKQPWYCSYNGAQQRCSNKKSKFYYRYGGRGIKLKMKPKDFKFLWFRDKTYLLNDPVIDRKDNDGNYEISNCRYIERGKNISKDSDQKGSHNSMAKLTEKQVIDIRKKFKTGNYTKSQLGKLFNVSRSHIKDIVRFRRWRHI